MAHKRLGKSSIAFDNPPSITASSSVAGVKEGEGPLRNCYDEILNDDLYEEKTWEKAESKLQKSAVYHLLRKADMKADAVDYIFAGDLLNQCTGSHYAMKDMGIPFFGLYGACSTMAESSSLAAMAIDGGYADNCIAITSSHFCSSEKQYRFPLEYGGQRPPTSQWTVTGSGALMISSHGNGPYITHATTGKIIDMGISDANNMGAAMAPAAVDTITAHFKDTGFSPSDYDMIITGDLAQIGSDITRDLLCSSGFDVAKNYFDCGNLVFDAQAQDVHSGGSGCGCSAIVFCGHIMDKIKKGELERVLFVGTGALMSPLNLLQGENIPGIAHAITVQRSL